MTVDEMVGWHHRLDAHEFEQAPGVGDGQGGLARCSPCSHKELDMGKLNKPQANLPTGCPRMGWPSRRGDPGDNFFPITVTKPGVPRS